MSRDYKNIRNKNKAGSQEKNKSNLFSFLVGLTLGAFITGSIFLNQHKQIVDVESSAIFIDKNNTEDKEDNEKNINTEITFDFPTMLEERQVAKIPEKKYKDEIIATIETNKDKSHTIYILQVGSFKKFKSADALKARLAFSGLSAYIQKKDIIGMGVSFRVFVGPFKDKEKLDEIKTILAANDVNSVISIEQKIESKSMWYLSWIKQKILIVSPNIKLT